MAFAKETLDADDVHLWCAPVPASIDAELAARYAALMSPEEAARHRRFHFDKDKRRFLVTRALVRTVLSRYADVAPADWAFEANAHGRPALTNPEAAGLRFNLTHSNTLVVLAVVRDREIGIDTESTQREAPLEVADRYFSDREAAALRALPPPDQPMRFWDLWTFKESYIKARGMGLALPLDGFSFRFDGPAHVDLSIDTAKIADDPARWQLQQFRPDGEHLLGVCLDTTRPDDPRFLLRRIEPLRGESPIDTVPLRRSPRR